MPRNKQQGTRFYQVSHSLRIHLWLLAALCLLSLPIAASLARPYPWLPPVWGVVSLSCLAWAVWSSRSPKG